MKIPVIIESPFKGDETTNKAYARACMLDSLTRGEAPFMSHLLYTQVLDDSIPEQRKLGIEAGLVIGQCCQKTVVYTDLGISHGMELGILDANKHGRPVEMRTLPPFDIVKFKNIRLHISELFTEFCRASGLTKDQLKSKKRNDNLVYARHAWACIAHEVFPNAQLDEIGSFIDRDHATIIYYYKEVEDVKEKYRVYSEVKRKMNL